MAMMRNGVMMIGETGRGGRGGEMAGVGRGGGKGGGGTGKVGTHPKNKQRTGAQKQKARLARVQGEEGAAPKGTEAYSVQRLSAMGLSRFARLDRRTKEQMKTEIMPCMLGCTEGRGRMRL